MLGSEREGEAHDRFPVSTPRKVSTLTASFYVIVDDPDTHYERAKAAGAEIVVELTDQDYGSRLHGPRPRGASLDVRDLPADQRQRGMIDAPLEIWRKT